MKKSLIITPFILALFSLSPLYASLVAGNESVVVNTRASSSPSIFDFSSALRGDLFFSLIQKGKLESLEELFSNKELLAEVEKFELENPSSFSLVLAFCKMYGYGIEKDEAQAKDFLEGYVNLPIAKIKENHLELIARSPLKGAKEMVFDIATRLRDKGEQKYYIMCLRNGYGIQPDKVKAVELACQMKNATELSVLNAILRDFVDLYLKGISNKAMEELVFCTLQDFLRQGNNEHRGIYYNLLNLGYGDESGKVMLFEKTNKILENNPENIRELETLAFYYEKAVGTEKDEAKAKALRQQIDDILAKNTFTNMSYEYQRLGLSIYASSNKDLRPFYSPKMRKFYLAKSKSCLFEMDIASMSEQDKALMYEYREIFKSFFDENGKEIKPFKDLNEQKAKLGEFYKKVIALESQAIEQMANYAVIYKGKNIGLDSLGFRVFSLPYFLEASDYCPKLYPLLAYCYHYARACRGDKKLAADTYLKLALHTDDKHEKSAAFYSAFALYTYLGDYEALKTIIDKSEEAFGAGIELDIKKARFYLMESKYKDVEYARVLIEKIKEGSDGYAEHYLLSPLAAISSRDNLVLGELQFWAADKLYKAGKDEKLSNIYRVLVPAYFEGIYCERDIAKAGSLLVEYVEKSHEDYGDFTIECLSQLMLDVENKDEAVFRDTLDAMLKLRVNSAPLNLMKALAIDKGFAYEKDIDQRDLYLKKASRTALYHLTTNYSTLLPSDSMLKKLVELNSNSSQTALFDAYIRLGDLENAAKIAKNYDSSHIQKDYYYENAAYLILKGDTPEKIALRYLKPKERGQNLIYSSMLYEGAGVPQDKEKALEGFKVTAELWDKDMGYDARVWLWKYYTENDQADQAQALIDSKTQGITLYNAKLLLSTAKNFADNLDKALVARTFNLPPSIEYAKYFLELSEDKYLADYAVELLSLYGKNPKLKNLEKKLEIRKKSKETLNQSKATYKEEVNYKKNVKWEIRHL